MIKHYCDKCQKEIEEKWQTERLEKQINRRKR